MARIHVEQHSCQGDGHNVDHRYAYSEFDWCNKGNRFGTRDHFQNPGSEYEKRADGPEEDELPLHELLSLPFNSASDEHVMAGCVTG
ncbi:hypothetical protein [Dokdonella sp.]|uniref:hypothetical protein n=1 Tax=Dokdonella sp. TaxID=2291710 RepID=UPI003528B0B0